jgi:ABC-type glycerol-3-phosphate transport system permease component
METRDQRDSTSPLAVLLALATAFIVLAIGGLFASRQSLWVDETTQLNGIAMGPLHVLSWLLGDRTYLNGVPPDRNPPLSFFLGQLWGMAFGRQVYAMRWMGIVAVAVAAGTLTWTLVRQAGWIGALAGLACFAAVPQVASMAAEVRPYPLMLLFASLAWVSFVALLDSEEPRARHWLAFSATCVLASYTHFFGILMTVGLLFGLLVDAWMQGKRKAPVLRSAAILMGLCLGALPFARQAAHISATVHTIHSSEVLGRTGRLILRLFVSPLVAVSVLGTGLLLGCYVLFTIESFRNHPDRRVVRAIASALMLPLVLCVATAFVTPTFDALATHYNAWMLPGIALAVAFGVRGLARKRSLLAWGMVLVVAAINGLGCYRLNSSDCFTHGPHKAIMRELTGERSRRTAIVVDKTEEWAFVYFPLRYEQGPQPSVFLASTESAVGSLWRVEPEATVPLEDLQKQDYVLLIRAKLLHTRELGNELDGHLIALPSSSLLEHFERDPSWRQVSKFRHVSFVSAQGTLFERVTSKGDVAEAHP